MDQGRQIEKALREMFPFLEVSPDDALASYVEAAPAKPGGLLRRFYLFRASSAVLPDDVDDIQPFIEQRYRSVLSAAHSARWTVLTAAVGSRSGVALYLGFMTAGDTGESDPYVFERRLRGLLPGLDLRFEETTTVESFTPGKTYGGIIAGIPTLKIDDERQHFSLPAILRAMHGEEYILLLMARPVARDELAQQQRALWKAQDTCHKMARRTRQHGGGGSHSWHEDRTDGGSRSRATTEGPHIGSQLKNLLLGGQLSESYQETVNQGRTRGVGGESHWSESLSQEEQDSMALDLEHLAQHHGDRLMKAANVGAWETAITFATATQPGRDILAGVLLGALAKPSTVAIPPRAYAADLNDDCPLLVPKADKVSSVFPRSLASYLTSEELASLSAPPSENLPGYEIRRTPVLSLTDVRPISSSDSHSLGNICDHGRPLEGVDVRLSSADLTKHLFVCGLTGAGKTTTVKEILASAHVPFLVLESAKRDYRQLLGCPSLAERLRILAPGDASIAPLQLNPFHIMYGVPAGVHIDYLKAIFNASFSLYGPMPYIVEQCLHNIYRKRGWDLTAGTHPQLLDPDGQPNEQRYKERESRCYFPTLLDLRDEVQDYVQSQLDYRGELSDNIRTAIITRLDSLAVGSKGLLFNSSEPPPMEELLDHPTVLELEALSDDDDKAFLVGLLLTLISEYRQTKDPARNPYAPRQGSELQHILVIEEAHRLLRNVTQERQTEHLGNPRGKAVEFFANAVSEMRSVGQGVIVVEQIPSKLLPDVIKNTNTKIVHRLVAYEDQALLASTLGLKEYEAIYLTSLQTGHALYAREGMQRPIEVKIKQPPHPRKVSDNRVHEIYEERLPYMAADAEETAEATAVRHTLGPDGYAVVSRLLCTLACGESSECPSYADRAIAQVKSLLLQHNHSSSESSIKSFLSTGIVELLANGTFCLKDGSVRTVTPLVTALLDGDEQAGPDFQQWIAQGWGVTDIQDGAIRRIHELALDRALGARITVDDAPAIDRIVRTYFIVDIPDVRRETAKRVIARLGGAPWNP